MSKRRAKPLPAQVIGPCTDTQGKDVAEAVGLVRRLTINEMVDRFLRWPLPKSVCSDLCVTDSKYQYPRFGTSLLSATEAKAMLEYVLADNATGDRP